MEERDSLVDGAYGAARGLVGCRRCLCLDKSTLTATCDDDKVSGDKGCAQVFARPSSPGNDLPGLDELSLNVLRARHACGLCRILLLHLVVDGDDGETSVGIDDGHVGE